MLGHESPAFTLSQYAHVLPGMQAAAAQQIRAAHERELREGQVDVASVMGPDSR